LAKRVYMKMRRNIGKKKYFSEKIHVRSHLRALLANGLLVQQESNTKKLSWVMYDSRWIITVVSLCSDQFL